MARPKYEAVVGIDFEGLTPAIRVERGDLLPGNISADEIKDLLNSGVIKEVPVNAERRSVE